MSTSLGFIVLSPLFSSFWTHLCTVSGTQSMSRESMTEKNEFHFNKHSAKIL